MEEHIYKALLNEIKDEELLLKLEDLLDKAETSDIPEDIDFLKNELENLKEQRSR